MTPPLPPALILAGGLGTRLRSTIGAETPKPLASIDGIPFLQHLLSWVQAQGVESVILATGHLAGAFESQVHSYAPRGMQIQFSREDQPLGTGGAVRHALPLLPGGPVFVLNGDSVASVNLADLHKFHREAGSGASLALVQVPDAARFGTVTTDTSGRVTQFSEKTHRAGPGQINAGMYLLSEEVIASIPAGKVSLETEIFPKLIGNGLFGKAFAGEFIDIGTPESYAEAGAFFARFAG